MSEPLLSAVASIDRRRAGIAALALGLLLGLLIWRDVFASTVLLCQRRATNTRCTVSEAHFGLEGGTLVIADVQGAYVEDEGYDHPRPRLVLQGAGGDVPLPGSVAWSGSQQRAAAAQVDGFAGDPRAQSMRFEERQTFGRTVGALACLGALLWVVWPRRKPALEHEPPETEPLPGVAVAAPLTMAQPAPPFSQRVFGALLLRRAAYRELGDDRASTLPAFVIVAMSALVIGYADGLDGSALAINGAPIAASVANANLRALAAAGAACVSWPAAAVVSSWLAAGKGGVRTLELGRALGFANLFHLLSLLRWGGLLAWPLFFVAAYVSTRAVCGAGRVRSLFATWCGQGFALLLAIPMWIAIMSLAS